MHGHLCTGMEFNFRSIFFNEVINAQILDNQPVNICFFQGLNHLRQVIDFIFGQDGIKSDIDLTFQAMGISGKGIQFLGGKILGTGASGKFGQAQIDGISPVIKGGISGFNVTGRR